MTKGYIKGSNNERWWCKEISYWWTDGKDPNVFCRTNEGTSDSTEIGDMKSRKECGFALTNVFCFEFKHYKNVDLLELLDDKGKKVFERWWEQVENNANRCSKIPILLFKRNYRKPYIALRCADLDYFYGCVGYFDGQSKLVWERPDYSELEYGDVCIMQWDYFKMKVNRDDIKEMYKQRR